MNDENKNLSDTEAESYLKERFKSLPRVVQDAITSADVSKHLQQLASTHQLHVDQWEILENEVQLTLLGLQPISDLAKNIAEELRISLEAATPLASDIITTVFEPIRQELERQLEHPEAHAAAQTTIETASAQVLAADAAVQAATAAPTAPTVTLAPATTGTAPASALAASAPPAPVPATATTVPQPAREVVRGTIAPAYQSDIASHERKTVAGDPYREQLT